MGEHSKDKRDIYYRRAKEGVAHEQLGVQAAARGRGVGDLFGGVTRAVDLCAAPGSWSQVLARRLRANAAAAGTPADDVRIVAVDLQEMAPIEGVALIQGDITSAETAQRVLAEFRGATASGAPTSSRVRRRARRDGDARPRRVHPGAAPPRGARDHHRAAAAGRHLRRQDLPRQGRHAAVRPAQGLLPRGLRRQAEVEPHLVGRGLRRRPRRARRRPASTPPR